MPSLILPTGDVDLGLTLAPFTMLTRDPTLRLAPGRFERASPTPEGPGTVVVSWDGSRPEARVDTHGEGASWLAARAAGLLGLLDDVTGFDPVTDPLRQLWRRHRGDRIASTGTIWHDLAWFVVQQRVTRGEAAAQWSRLVHGLGAAAPGPGDLMVLPPPAVIGRLGYADLHRFGIERQRADNLINAARAVHRLQDVDGLDRDAALSALGGVRGIGPWTTSCLATTTWGSPDTVITGDAGIPSLVAWVLAGEHRADDARLLELLEPHRPHRYRVIRLAFASGSRPPRRGARTPRHEIRRR